MNPRRCGTAIVAAALLGLLAGCGGDTDDTTSGDAGGAPPDPMDAGVGNDADGTDDTGVADGSGDAEVPAMITVDGQAHPSDPALGFMGGACRINDPDRPGRDFVAYFAESGERVEVSFLSPSDIEGSSDGVFRGSLGIGGRQEWSVESPEPWPWTGADSSTILAALSMEDPDGNPAEVTIDITCP